MGRVRSDFREPGKLFALTAIFAVVVVLTWGAANVRASELDPVPRSILVFYNSAENLSEDNNLFSGGLQMVANYLGYVVDYHDAAKRPLPDSEAMAPYAAVATTFFSGEMENPDGFNSWLLTQSEAGRKLIVLGVTARALPGKPNEEEAIVAAIMERLGLQEKPGFTMVRSLLRYARVDDAITGFERELPQPPISYQNIAANPDTTRTLVAVERTDKPGEAGAMVAIGPGGSYAAPEYFAWEDPITFRWQWYVDPFAFLELTLRDKGEPALPAFVPAMLNGTRLAFTHVDGDAFMGFTEVERDSSCAEVMLEKIFSHYELPFTISVIVAEVDPELKGSQEAVELAREIFALPNVEAASHTYSHPYVWNTAVKPQDDLGRYGYTIPGYEFDPHTEIIGSTQWIEENLTPPDKPCRILLWSGDCAPTRDQVALTIDAGILQMNGGDTVFDENHDSYSSIAPIYRYVGGLHQIYTGQANENILTNLWTGPFFGYRTIIETMERTGSPRLLAPVNPYYHFYSAEKQASLDALDAVYEWVLSQELAHVYASTWIRQANGFITARIENPEPNRFVFSDYGECRTVRFEPDALVPDLGASEGVLGYRRTAEGLYVFLDPAETVATVALGGDAPVRPHLQQASGMVKQLSAGDERVSFEYGGHAPGFVVLAGLKPEHEYAVTAVDGSSSTMSSDADGALRLEDLQAGNMEVRSK